MKYQFLFVAILAVSALVLATHTSPAHAQGFSSEIGLFCSESEKADVRHHVGGILKSEKYIRSDGSVHSIYHYRKNGMLERTEHYRTDGTTGITFYSSDINEQIHGPLQKLCGVVTLRFDYRADGTRKTMTTYHENGEPYRQIFYRPDQTVRRTDIISWDETQEARYFYRLDNSLQRIEIYCGESAPEPYLVIRFRCETQHFSHKTGIVVVRDIYDSNRGGELETRHFYRSNGIRSMSHDYRSSASRFMCHEHCSSGKVYSTTYYDAN